MAPRGILCKLVPLIWVRIGIEWGGCSWREFWTGEAVRDKLVVGLGVPGMAVVDVVGVEGRNGGCPEKEPERAPVALLPSCCERTRVESMG